MEDMTKAPALPGSSLYFPVLPTTPHSLPNKHSAHNSQGSYLHVGCVGRREIESGPLALRNLVLEVSSQPELFSDAQAIRPFLDPRLSLGLYFPNPVLPGAGCR